jgi:hypothetical protein
MSVNAAAVAQALSLCALRHTRTLAPIVSPGAVECPMFVPHSARTWDLWRATILFQFPATVVPYQGTTSGSAIHHANSGSVSPERRQQSTSRHRLSASVLCTKSWSSNVPECGGFDVRRYSLYPRFTVVPYQGTTSGRAVHHAKPGSVSPERRQRGTKPTLRISHLELLRHPQTKVPLT